MAPPQQADICTMVVMKAVAIFTTKYLIWFGEQLDIGICCCKTTTNVIHLLFPCSMLLKHFMVGFHVHAAEHQFFCTLMNI